MVIKNIAFAVIVIVLVVRLYVTWGNHNDSVKNKVYKSLQWLLGLLMVSLAINALAYYGFGIGKSIFGVSGSGSGANQLDNIDQTFSTSPINENNQSNDTVKYYNPLNGH
ncbi:hypothetical protein DRF69_18235 [Chryseobacterium sp. 5_R23647]|nr:hypothetical protein DRF69_18235 [Chryseobacterium sp. 5_R23647]